MTFVLELFETITISGRLLVSTYYGQAIRAHQPRKMNISSEHVNLRTSKFAEGLDSADGARAVDISSENTGLFKFAEGTGFCRCCYLVSCQRETHGADDCPIRQEMAEKWLPVSVQYSKPSTWNSDSVHTRSPRPSILRLLPSTLLQKLTNNWAYRTFDCLLEIAAAPEK